MNRVSVKQMGENLLYVKYVHSIVADACSLKNGRLCKVIFANYISGVRAFPDKRFSKALTESSKQYEKRYPSLAGPTMYKAARIRDGEKVSSSLNIWTLRILIVAIHSGPTHAPRIFAKTKILPH